MVYSQAAWPVQHKESPPSFLFVHKKQMLLYMVNIQVVKDLLAFDLQDLECSLALVPSVPTNTLSQHPTLVQCLSTEQRNFLA